MALFKDMVSEVVLVRMDSNKNREGCNSQIKGSKAKEVIKSFLLNKWMVRVLLFLVGLFNIFGIYQFMYSKKSNEDIEIVTKLLNDTIRDGDKVYLDIIVKNNSDKPIYNLELLTETFDKSYGKILGNETCKVLEELGPSEEGYCRVTYGKLEDNDTTIDSKFDGYIIHKKSIVILGILSFIYLVCIVALLKFTSDKRGLNLLILLFGVLLSVGFICLVYFINKTSRNDNLIYSYEDFVTIKVDDVNKKIRILVNYTDENMESLVDRNKNGVPEVGERIDIKKDSDGDGISDYFELYSCGTNPYMLDTFGSGSGDVNFDTDKDGLINLREIKLGSNPLNKDTDYDGLNDNVEIEFGTNMLEYDTDGDGMSDGFEVEQGYDPLVFDEKVTVIKEVEDGGDNKRDKVKVKAEVLTTGGIAESLNIENYNTILLNESVPGYIASAFDFTLNGNFERAEISFEIDSYWVNKKDVDPCIYYFNEETQLLEEVESVIDGNIVKAEVNHFSVYIVLNRAEVSQWMYEDIFVQNIDGFKRDVHGVDVAFVVDNSQSIELLDKDGYLKKLTSEFVNLLSDNDTASLILFTKVTNLVREYTTNYTELSQLILSIKRDSGQEENSGTDIIKGLEKGLEVLSKGKSNNRKYIFLITDGDVSWNNFDKFLFVQYLKAKKVSLYCVDIGVFSTNELKYMCEHSGGKYYTVNDIKNEEIAKCFETMEEQIINIDKDSNKDGLSDYDTELIMSGVLRTGTGIQLFNDYDMNLLATEKDIDMDGLLNGEEVSIQNINGVVYLKLNSHPYEEDTDDDGILDKEDEAPFTYGQKGGVIGELYLAVHPTKIHFIKMFNSGNILENIDTGHSWIVIHSYCDINFESKELKEGYIKCKLGEYIKFVPQHNLYPYKLENNSYMSLGYYPMDKANTSSVDDRMSDEQIGEILVEQQKLYQQNDISNANLLNDIITEDLRINQEFRNSMEYNYYHGSLAIKQELTYKQLMLMLESLDYDPVYFMPVYNCTHFAIKMWDLCAIDSQENIYFIPYDELAGQPSILYLKLHGILEKICNFHEFMYSKQVEMKTILEFDDIGNVIKGR